jgi:hypothetical protein
LRTAALTVEGDIDKRGAIPTFLDFEEIMPSPLTGGLANREALRYITGMNLELTDAQAAALEKELREIVENDYYPFSPRIRILREILHMIRPEPLTSGQRGGGAASTPVREPLPPLRYYEPPPATAKRRWRG